jgi:SNF family Na+-dependent transporter
VEQQPPKEQWGSRLGVILAVAGSAVGLGNFLRFPGQAAAHGGGAFMIPYFISFLLVGIPICWAEWTMGRYGGRWGFNSAPGIFSVLWRNRFSKYFGVLGLLIPVIIYMYYVYIESWCLAYACYYGSGAMELGRNPAAYSDKFGDLIGDGSDGAIFTGGIQPIFWFFGVTFLVNFFFVYRGLNKGIEAFCKIAMPLLILAAIIVVFRVLTLPEQPVPDPWQRSLPQVLPAEKWEALQAKATSQETTPEQMKSLVERAFEDYFDNVQAQDPAYKTDVPAAPPAGFLDKPDGMAVAMAELRAGETGNEYRAWVRETRDGLPRDVKLSLQQLEKRQLRQVAALSTEDTRIAAARQQALKTAANGTQRDTFTAAFEEDRIPEELNASSRAALESLASERDAIEEKIKRIADQRADLIRETVSASMPSLVAQLDSLDTSGEAGAAPLQLQQRAAALEISELPRSVWNGLGYMWNPDFEDLLDAKVWIAAAGQIFFSLSVGFGIVLCYASYLRRSDDVVLSGLTASTTNEFCEVVLGGLVALPATFIFLGTASTLAIIESQSSFGLGFNALPAVFANMPAGRWFGMLWFGLLFLAGVTSSLSMLQPAIAFLEEGFGLTRRVSVASLGLLTVSGALAVIYFSKDSTALGTMDFWVGNVAIYILATVQIILFGWVIGVDRGFEEAHRGAHLSIPWLFKPVMKFVTPAFLLVVFSVWIYQSVGARLVAMMESPPVMLTVLYMAIIALFLVLMIGLAGERWRRQGKGEKEEADA